MTYDELMESLACQLVDAHLAAQAALRAAKDEDGAPVEALRKMEAKIARLALDGNSLADHGVTYDEMRHMESLYRGAKLAGLV